MGENKATILPVRPVRPLDCLCDQSGHCTACATSQANGLLVRPVTVQNHFFVNNKFTQVKIYYLP